MSWRKNGGDTTLDFDGIVAGDNLAVTFDSVAQFRASANIPIETASVTIRGYEGASDPGGDTFLIDRSDTASTDNGIDLFVNTDGLRIRRFDRKTIKLEECGATGLGSSSSSRDQSAWDRALALAFSRTSFDENVTIQIPPGTYRLKGDSILSANSYGTSVGRKWVHFKGSGANTIIEIEPDGSTPSWFYNNDPGKDFIYAVFQDFILKGTDSSLSNGLKLNPTGGAPAQGFSFFNVHFDNLAVGYETAGTILGSETTMFGGRFRNCSKCIVLNNPQSVNHRFYGTDFELVNDVVLEVGPNGGGNVNIRDASIIPYQNSAAKIFNITRSSSLGSNNGVFTFSGIRAELRDDSTIGVIDGTNQDGSAAVVIENSTFTDEPENTARNIVTVDALSSVVIKDSTLSSSNFGLEITTATNSGFTWHGGKIELIRCHVNSGISGRVTIPESSFRSAHVSFKDCIPIGGNPVTDRREHYAMDADIGALVSGNGGNLQLKIKRSQLFNPTSGWPTNTGYGEHILYMPPGARILKLVIWRPGGTNTSAYSLIIGSDDKAATYLETNSATGNTDHFGEIEYSINNAITLTDNILRLWCNGTPGGVLSRGGVAYVEYI